MGLTNELRECAGGCVCALLGCVCVRILLGKGDICLGMGGGIGRLFSGIGLGEAWLL